MTVPTPTRLPGDPIPPPEPPYPWKVGVGMVGLVALVLLVVWLAFQLVKGPPTAGEFPSPATATAIQRDFEATVSAADTARPRPTSRPATLAPTVGSTTAPAALPAPTVVRASTPRPATTAPGAVDPTVAPVAATPAAPAAATSAPTESVPARATTTSGNASSESATPTPRPTVAPELVKDVSDAYTRYWQVVADTALSLDSAPLDQVAAGDQLTALQKNLEQDRAAGRATHMDVQHSFLVISASPTQAEVADRTHDMSILVDANTREPLPGQTTPSPDEAPEVDAILDLQLIDGIWKVVYAARALEGYTP